MAQSEGLKRLLQPQSLAVIGGKEAQEVIRQCDRMNFSGPIYPIHSNKDRIEGRDCFARIADLPATPDAAFIAVNRHATIETVLRI